MKLLSTLVFVVITVLSSAQINHWETVVFDTDTWSYFVGTSEPDANWTNNGFDDSAWLTGPGGFGYGDGDDGTTISAVASVYTRIEFTIVDTSEIDQVILNVDYDDAYVAYLNGIEISRANVLGTPPTYSTFSTGLHEAELYLGITPVNVILSATNMGLLVSGTNTLTIQTHNESLSSSDMTSRGFLSVGINTTTSNYSPTPSWFIEPVTTTSYLPLIIINTNGQTIVQSPKIMADFGIIYNGTGNINTSTDVQNEYKGKIRIDIRGESSAGFAKKSYGFETVNVLGVDVDAAFLGFPLEEDWILYGPYSDKTLLNNVIIMKLGRQMGQYASRTRMVEVIINDDYKGVYVMMEKIKKDVNRVNIAKLRTNDIAGIELTGGYIFRLDKGANGGWLSNYDIQGQAGNKLWFQYYYPKDVDIVLPQMNYLIAYVDSFESAINSATFMNTSGKRYNEYIDIYSFIDTYILNEFSKNIDAYGLSSYFNKDKGGKIKAGPLWDFNLSLGNADYCNGEDYTGWEYDELCQSNPFWWTNFLTDTMYTRLLKCRWEELRTNLLNTDTITNWIDSMAADLALPASRNYSKWQTLGFYVWPNPWPWPTTYTGVIDKMKAWVTGRLSWMDSNMPGIASGCEDWNQGVNLPLIVQRTTNEIVLYPNPASDLLEILSGETVILGEIYSVNGQQLQSIQYPITFNVKALSQGIYFVKLYKENGDISIGRFVKK